MRARRTFALEVGRLEVGDRVVAESFRVEAAWIAGDEVLGLEPRRQPLQMTVAVERVRQKVAAHAHTHHHQPIQLSTNSNLHRSAMRHHVIPFPHWLLIPISLLWSIFRH